MHLRPMYSLFLTLSEQSIALRAPAVHGVSSKENDQNMRKTIIYIIILTKIGSHFCISPIDLDETLV